MADRSYLASRLATSSWSISGGTVMTLDVRISATLSGPSASRRSRSDTTPSRSPVRGERVHVVDGLGLLPLLADALDDFAHRHHRRDRHVVGRHQAAGAVARATSRAPRRLRRPRGLICSRLASTCPPTSSGSSLMRSARSSDDISTAICAVDSGPSWLDDGCLPLVVEALGTRVDRADRGRDVVRRARRPHQGAVGRGGRAGAREPQANQSGSRRGRRGARQVAGLQRGSLDDDRLRVGHADGRERGHPEHPQEGEGGGPILYVYALSRERRLEPWSRCAISSADGPVKVAEIFDVQRHRQSRRDETSGRGGQATHKYDLSAIPRAETLLG